MAKRKRQQPRQRNKAFPIVWVLALVFVVAVGGAVLWQILAGGGARMAFEDFRNYTTFSNEEMSRAYRFALANPNGILNYIPCFCGCVYHGDTNNRDCYINGFTQAGKPIFDPHASG